MMERKIIFALFLLSFRLPRMDAMDLFSELDFSEMTKTLKMNATVKDISKYIWKIDIYLGRKFINDKMIGCENGLENLMNSTLTMAVIEENLYQILIDDFVLIYEDIYRRYDPHKHSIFLSENKVFHHQRDQAIQKCYPFSIELLNKNRNDWQMRNSFRDRVRATVIKDQSSSIPNYLKDLISVHYWFRKNSTMNDSIMHALTFEYEMRTIIEPYSFGSIDFFVNANIDGIYYIFTINDTSKLTNLYRKNITIYLATVCLSNSKRNHLRLKTSNLDRFCWEASKLIKKFEFVFNIDQFVYFISINSKRIFYINKNFFFDFNVDYPFEWINFNEFFRCGHRKMLYKPSEKSKDNEKSNSLPEPKQLYRFSRMKEHDKIRALLLLLIGSKGFGLLVYFTFNLYVLRSS